MNAGVTDISEQLTLSLGGDTVSGSKCSSLRYFYVGRAQIIIGGKANDEVRNVLPEIYGF